MADRNLLTLYQVLPGLVSFVVTAVGTYFLIPRLLRNGIIGRDMHKQGRPPVAEMGGIAIFAGIVAGVSVSIAISTFGPPLFVRVPLVTAALATIGIIAVIGIADDIIAIRQSVKALLPIFSSLPLVAIAAGNPTMFIPGLGHVNFGLLYPLVVVPLAITGAANATNMLAGWNGLEAGLGLILLGTLSFYGAVAQNTTLLAISLPGATACLAFLMFNWYPARVFPGDVGALTIGGAFGAAVVIGNAEFLGAILMIPFVLDLAMKVRHRFPKTFGQLEGARLVAPQARPPMGLGQLFLYVSGGMTERTLVASLLAFQAVFAVGGLFFVLYFLG